MKKMLALLLALSIIFALCACGSKETGGNTAAKNQEDRVAIEEIELSSWASGSAFITIKIRNLSTEKTSMLVYFNALDANGDILCKVEASVEDLDAGQAETTAPYKVDCAYTDIAAIDFTNYRFEDRVYRSDGHSYDPTVTFEADFIADYIFPISSGSDEAVSSQPVELTLGDTIKTDSVEITVYDISYQDSVKFSNNGSMGASGDKILCCLDMDFKNISKQQMSPQDYLDVKVDYNEGFIYSTADEMSYFIDQKHEGHYIFFWYGGDAQGVNSSLAPLEGSRYILAIPCVPDLAEDSTSPLKITFTLPSGETVQTYEYIVR